MPKTYKIGFMGGAFRGREMPDGLTERAREVGREIARNNCILITGACMGTPYEAALGASEQGGMILGFSPSIDLKGHTEPPVSYPSPPKGMILVYTGMGKEGRNLISIRTSDAAIFCSGFAGTLTEFALAYHMGKVIGVLEGTGGITEKIPEIAVAIQKNTGAVLVLDSDPKALVEKVIKTLNERD